MLRQAVGFRLRCTLLTIFVAAGLSNLVPLSAQSDSRGLSQGWPSFSVGHYSDAAKLWIDASAEELRRDRDSAALRHAALGNVLATMAFERARDARAYESWANAIRFYLEAGTTWEAERDELQKRYRRAAQASAALEGASLRLSTFDQLVMDMQRTAGLLTYSGPPSGLRVPGADGPALQVSPQYFAGASDTKSEAASEARESGFGNDTSQGSGSTDEGPSLGGRLVAPGNPRNQETQVAEPALDPKEVSAKSTEPIAHVLVASPGAPHFSDDDQQAAVLAWRYVQANRQPQTGLINGKDGYPFVTVADIADALAVEVAAEGLKLISLESFERETALLLTTLAQLPLYHDELFNREYDARAGRFVDLSGRISPSGSGWSATDVGRLLVWLKILGARYPDYSDTTTSIVRRLRMRRMVAGGQLASAIFDADNEQVVTDARLGAEQYTAAALSLWGLDLSSILNYDHARSVRSNGVLLIADRRTRGFISPHIFPTAVIEIGGIDGCFERIGLHLLTAQLDRRRRSGVPTMIADELLDKAPWFVYSSVLDDEEKWRVATYQNESRPELRTQSTRAAFLWDAVFPTAAVRRLRLQAQRSNAATRGFYSGIYESGEPNHALTLATNAAILEAMLYVNNERLPFLRFDNPIGKCDIPE